MRHVNLFYSAYFYTLFYAGGYLPLLCNFLRRPCKKYLIGVAGLILNFFNYKLG